MKRNGLVWVGFLATAIASPVAVSLLPGLLESVTTTVRADDVDLIDDLSIPNNRDSEANGAIVVTREDGEEVADPRAFFLKLVKQKAALLSPQELSNEIEKLQTEIVELEATRQLREATRQLEELTARHPRSIASQKAKVMLNSLNQVNSNGLVDEFGNVIAPPTSYRRPTKDSSDDEPPQLVNPRRKTRDILDGR